MTEGEVSQLRKPLSMWPIVREAYLRTWTHRQHFGRLLIVPVILGTLLSIANTYWFSIAETSSTLFNVVDWLIFLPHYMIFTLLAVSCHRSILIGEHSVSRFGVPAWSWRETRFCFLLLAIHVAAWIIVFFLAVLFGIAGGLALSTAKGIMGQSMLTPDDARLIIYPTMALAAVPFAYIVGRSSLILPGIAVDLQPQMKLVWSYSEGNGWRVTVLVGGVPLVVTALYGLFTFTLVKLTGGSIEEGMDWRGASSILTSGVQAVLYYVLATVEVAILSLTFKELSGWQPSEAQVGQGKE